MAYTKYSLTPANNTATPPDGAPEGMLPSAVNDTMRDMMAQIRDCGDGIRDGTYTMTAPKITGGTITGATLTGNTFTSPVISGGSINNTPIGATTANTGAFTTLSATGVTTVQAGTVSAPAITTSGDTNTGIFFPAADTIAFTEGGVESMRITSAGEVLIGTTSTATSSTLNINSAGYQPLYVNTTIAGGGGAAFSRSGTQALYIGTAGSSWLTGSSTADGLMRSEANMLFATGNTERMRIPTAGGVQSAGSISVGGATPTTSGAGITFPATQSASSDANTLDDYEEGTWTPTILTGYTGTITYSSQSGRYTKIGDVVTFSFRISVSSGTRNTNILSFSLPFVGKNIGFQTGFASWAYANSSVIGSNTTNLPTLYPDTNAAIMYCYKTTPDAFAGTDLAGTTPDMYIGGTYLTAT